MGLYLSRICIENFKCYGEMTEIPVSPLTLMMGANNTGKSAALQALLVLKQTLECDAPDTDLLLSGKYASLGGFHDVLHNRQGEMFTIGAEAKRTGGEMDHSKISVFWRFGTPGEEGRYLEEIKCVIGDSEVTLRRAEGCIYDVVLNGERAGFEVQTDNLRIVRVLTDHDGESAGKNHDPSTGDYTVPDGRGVDGRVLPDQITAGDGVYPLVSAALSGYDEVLGEILGKIRYLGPAGVTPGRYGFAARGRSAPPYENVKREYILPDFGTDHMTICDAAGEWLAHLDTAGGIEAAGPGVSVCNRYNIKTDIMNAGAGAASVLPVIFTGLLSEKGEYLVFEHPESCLHSYAQSRLADLFAALVRAGRKIIVETHSETLLLRLRYLVLAEKINAGDIALDFFRNDHDGSALVSRGCILRVLCPRSVLNFDMKKASFRMLLTT